MKTCLYVKCGKPINDDRKLRKFCSIKCRESHRKFCYDLCPYCSEKKSSRAFTCCKQECINKQRKKGQNDRWSDSQEDKKKYTLKIEELKRRRAVELLFEAKSRDTDINKSIQEYLKNGGSIKKLKFVSYFIESDLDEFDYIDQNENI